MTDTADAPETTEAAPSTNEQAVADAINAQASSDEPDFGFVLDKYRADGRSDQDAAMEQAKAYKELQSKFGAFTGAPDDYELALSEEMSERIDIEDYKDDPILEEARSMAKEMGINNDGFNKLTELYFKGQLADIDAMENVREEEMKALGSRAQARLENITAWASSNFDAETNEKIGGLLTSAQNVEVVEALIAKSRNAPQVNDVNPAPAISHSELVAMQTAKDEFGNPKMNDPEYRAKVQKLYSQRFGEQPHNVTVG